MCTIVHTYICTCVVVHVVVPVFCIFLYIFFIKKYKIILNFLAKVIVQKFLKVENPAPVCIGISQARYSKYLAMMTTIVGDDGVGVTAGQFIQHRGNCFDHWR